jgi:hypothetical protein
MFLVGELYIPTSDQWNSNVGISFHQCWKPLSTDDNYIHYYWWSEDMVWYMKEWIHIKDWYVQNNWKSVMFLGLRVLSILNVYKQFSTNK